MFNQHFLRVKFLLLNAFSYFFEFFLQLFKVKWNGVHFSHGGRAFIQLDLVYVFMDREILLRLIKWVWLLLGSKCVTGIELLILIVSILLVNRVFYLELIGPLKVLLRNVKHRGLIFPILHWCHLQHHLVQKVSVIHFESKLPFHIKLRSSRKC